MGAGACNIASVDDTSAPTDHQAVQLAKGKYMSTARMESRLWSRLPEELIERVLTFLPVPALFRCRSVCTKWNELSRQQKFLAEWDRNEGRREYLFVTRYLNGDERESEPWDSNSYVDDAFWHKTCFLDLDERRWYSMPTDASLAAPNDNDALRHSSIDGGLVCELSWLDGICNLDMLDPVANMRQKLPNSTSDNELVCDPTGDEIPMVVTVVDDVNCSFKVFLMRRSFDFGPDCQAGFFMYDSSTGSWRRLVIPPEALGERLRGLVGKMIGESAVFFEGNLYVAIRTQGNFPDTYILSFNLDENFWRHALSVRGVLDPECPQLIVSGNRMFISLWSRKPNYIDSFFEIREIFLDRRWCRQLVRIQYPHLRRISGESGFSMIQYGFPLNSDSFVLLTRQSGRLLTYDQSSGAVGAFPAHPLRLSVQDAVELDERGRFPRYRARLSNLSFSNILRVPT